MKPDWDQLGEHFAGSSSVLIGDADCTGPTKAKCTEYGVTGERRDRDQEGKIERERESGKERVGKRERERESGKERVGKRERERESGKEREMRLRSIGVCVRGNADACLLSRRFA